MSGSPYSVLAGVSVLFVLSLCAGCFSTGIGDAAYDNGSILVNVSHHAEPMDATIQVSVYRITGLTQEPYTVISTPVSLVRGGNSIAVPAVLAPGNYKLYVYVLSEGDRRTATIRDIVV